MDKDRQEVILRAVFILMFLVGFSLVAFTGKNIGIAFMLLGLWMMELDHWNKTCPKK